MDKPRGGKEGKSQMEPRKMEGKARGMESIDGQRERQIETNERERKGG